MVYINLAVVPDKLNFACRCQSKRIRRKEKNSRIVGKKGTGQLPFDSKIGLWGFPFRQLNDKVKNKKFFLIILTEKKVGRIMNVLGNSSGNFLIYRSLNFEYYKSFVMILFLSEKKNIFFYREQFIFLSFEQLKENIKIHNKDYIIFKISKIETSTLDPSFCKKRHKKSHQ